MLFTTKAIVLNQIKYGDNDAIVKCYTQQFGIKSFYVRGVRAKKNNKIAALSPLNKIEIACNVKENTGLSILKNVTVYAPYNSIGINFYKNTIALFMAEFLAKTLQEESADLNLFEFLEHTLSTLDQVDEFANFHIAFLCKFSGFLGIMPTLNYQKGFCFNLEEGYFMPISQSLSKNMLNNVLSEKLYLFFGNNFDVLLSTELNRVQRKELLTAILDFYHFQFNGLGKLNSLEILTQIMH